MGNESKRPEQKENDGSGQNSKKNKNPKNEKSLHPIFI